MEKVLITGANGFVGTALCKALTEQGTPFTACVRQRAGSGFSAPAVFETGDLSDEIDWAPALVGCSVVVHLAARVHMMRIEVKPGASLSLQMHHHRSEHWIVVSGMAKVVNGEQELFVNTNESTFIPAAHKHRLENPGVLDLVMIEVQSGEYLGEDDIVRFEDVYGRVPQGLITSFL